MFAELEWYVVRRSREFAVVLLGTICGEQWWGWCQRKFLRLCYFNVKQKFCFLLLAMRLAISARYGEEGRNVLETDCRLFFQLLVDRIVR